ncbi:hypothetical protein ONA02_04635 [Mycoplasmopsis felis]|uniref:hypothetical protein n=1 Tax=Mycoplasmopsis felis TaxID=33923 RepID=UPI0022862584|nr:hypothetical protein [Mycoplasmopsis felis]WAM01913.1 hypothetical protein ONA02_04635 [Mycoplasmopsis felis]
MIEKFKKVLIPDGAKISKRKNAWYVQVVVKREYIKSKKYYKETKVAVGKKVSMGDDETYMFPNLITLFILKKVKLKK